MCALGALAGRFGSVRKASFDLSAACDISRPLNFTVRHSTMPHNDWISVGEYANSSSAQVVSQRLTVEGVPHRIETSGLPRRGDLTCWIWAPPEWVDKAKEILSRDAVSEEELTKLAMSYPPPDDAGPLK